MRSNPKNSENQRIKLQRRKEHNPLPPGKELERFPRGMVAENHAGLGAQFSQVEVGQKEGLQADNQVFVGRKNVVIGELDLAVEVLAAALGAELDNIVRQVFFRFLVPMMMPHTMHAFRGCITETARKVMVFSTIVELHIPPDRNEQHRESHQKGADLQQAFFHAAKVQKIPKRQA